MVKKTFKPPQSRRLQEELVELGAKRKGRGLEQERNILTLPEKAPKQDYLTRLRELRTQQEKEEFEAMRLPKLKGKYLANRS